MPILPHRTHSQTANVTDRSHKSLGPESPIAVIGTGPAGLRMVRELRRRLPDCPILLFGDEPLSSHSRSKARLNLADEIDRAEPDNIADLLKDPHILLHRNEPIIRIDRTKRAVFNRYGDVFVYRYLVFATGSQPRIPVIPGIDLTGVFTFRDMTDSHRLFASKTRSRHALVVGGGLLGLECAKALRRFNTRVTVVEKNDHLMFQQLDTQGAEMLRKHVESLGISVIANSSVREILGTYGVQGVELSSGEFIRCDRVVLATGIQPNIDLAKQSGLRTHRGILVDDRLQTSDPSIFAVGECVEHDGRVSDLIAPGYEQAAVAARVMAGDKAAYNGSLSITSLRVVGLSITSIGYVQEHDWSRDDPCYINESAALYRKLVMQGGRLVGVVAVGEWREIPRLRDLLHNKRRIRPWRLRRFRMKGTLWSENRGVNPLKWPQRTRICHCTGISLGQIKTDLKGGITSVSQLRETTGVGSVCGSCQPLLGELVNAYKKKSARRRQPFTITARLLVIALTLSLLTVLVTLPSLLDGIQSVVHWRNSVTPQLSGFGLSALGVVFGMLSVRLRISPLRSLHMSLWRLLQICIFPLVMLALILHVELHSVKVLDLLLLLAFSGLLVSVNLFDLFNALEKRLPSGLVRRSRQLSLRGRAVLMWTVPALLGLHIAKSYHLIGLAWD